MPSVLPSALTCLREFVLEYFAIWMTKLYLLTIRVPRWIMLLVSGSIASFAINLFHGWGAKKTAAAPKPAARPAAAVAATPAPVPATAAPASPSKAKQRKGKGKK